MNLKAGLMMLAVAATGMIGCGDDTGAMDGPIADLSMKMPADLSMTNNDLGSSMAASVMVGPGGTLTFAPNQVTIPPGGTVTWTFISGSHTVTSGPLTGTGAGAADGVFCSASANAPTMASCAAETGKGAGAVYSHTFATAGTFTYFCNVHGAATMNGTVHVQ